MARFAASGKSRREFAAEAGVGLAIFQYWLYKLRREAQAGAARKTAPKEVRLVPVAVRARLVPAQIEMRIAGVRMRVPVGVDPAYVARVVFALRETARC
jgi:transposase